MSSAPSAAPPAREIVRDARWLAQALDPNAGVVRLIEMTPDGYRAASFLDDRMLQAPVHSVTRPFAEIAAAIPADARGDARWIFHIGHVGSTLLARLLGELHGVLAVREPRILRDVAASGRRDQYVPAVRKLLSRTFAPGEIALVKATSFVSEIAAELVVSGERALFLYAKPRHYIASILAGENSVRELAALADSRSRRMAERVRGLSGHGPAHLAAAAWACEMTALEAAAEAMADRHVRWADFDALLGDIEGALAGLAQFFGFEASDERVREIARGPLMGRYSKALEYEYSPSLRRELIEQEIRLQGRAIDEAVAMLAQVAKDSPLLASTLARS
ncbi:hypothetical protein [Sphingomonas sp.]|uniref:hypothetical protein n=1 Tax=Sphingomonas sp. TaxID=28214 RepID=UPI00183EEAAA|nr:hypothetical protein [Sphingomonas sp.]MBA3511647.1 hypothetical protein [Sphingomonas sp.]